MKITSETHLLNIQFYFTEQFPKLKLDFFKTKHDRKELSSLNDEVMEDLKVKDSNPYFTEKTLLLLSTETVSEFEQRMENEFGLHVQVMRKSHDIWIQTSVTDDWTLAKQMEHAI
jgi:hypothetical protein